MDNATLLVFGEGNHEHDLFVRSILEYKGVFGTLIEETAGGRALALEPGVSAQALQLVPGLLGPAVAAVPPTPAPDHKAVARQPVSIAIGKFQAATAKKALQGPKSDREILLQNQGISPYRNTI